MDRWALALEEKIENSDSEPSKIINIYAENDCQIADTTSITGRMYTGAVLFLAKYWKYGEELRKWHNAKYNYDGDGLVDNTSHIIP